MSKDSLLKFSQEQIKDLRYIGYSYFKEGMHTSALKFFEALILIDKNQPYDFQTLGAIYLEIGDHRRALQYLDQALKMVPSHELTLLNKARTLLSLGRIREGLALAIELEKSLDAKIASSAKALILAFD
jgi:tetratricopeptide (TPR) repeat protein